MEPGEDERSCLKREIKEELSIDIKITNHLINNTFIYTNKTICLRCFICEISDGEVVATDHDRIEWIVPEELNNYIFAPADVAVVDALKAYLKSKT